MIYKKRKRRFRPEKGAKGFRFSEIISEECKESAAELKKHWSIFLEDFRRGKIRILRKILKDTKFKVSGSLALITKEDRSSRYIRFTWEVENNNIAILLPLDFDGDIAIYKKNKGQIDAVEIRGIIEILTDKIRNYIERQTK